MPSGLPYLENLSQPDLRPQAKPLLMQRCMDVLLQIAALPQGRPFAQPVSDVCFLNHWQGLTCRNPHWCCAAKSCSVRSVYHFAWVPLQGWLEFAIGQKHFACPDLGFRNPDLGFRN